MDENSCGISAQIMVLPPRAIALREGGAPLLLADEAHFTPETLVFALARHWEEGKKLLFGGALSKYFWPRFPQAARICLAAESARADADTIYWDVLFQLYPALRAFCWKGRVYQNLAALGREALSRLRAGDASDTPFYAEILDAQLLTRYAAITGAREAVRTIEDAYQIESAGYGDPMRAYYLMAYLLSGEKRFRLDERDFSTTPALAEHLGTVLSRSLGAFREVCHRLVDDKGNLVPALEAWLIAIGKRRALEDWKALMNE